jgi:hypothetical protein
MAMNWVWGEKKKALKEIEVDTVNIAKPRKDTRLSIRIELDVNHPEDVAAFGAVLDAGIQFIMPEGVNAHSARIMDIDVQS